MRYPPTATREAAPQQKDYPKLVTLAVLHMAQSFPGAFAGTALLAYENRRIARAGGDPRRKKVPTFDEAQEAALAQKRLEASR